MRTETNFPLSVVAIRVNQPLGEFYVVNLNADVLLELTYSSPLRMEEDLAESDNPYSSLTGIQRSLKPSREKEIGDFIDSTEAAFPNAIILGANYSDDGQLIEDEGSRWRIESNEGGCDKLIIPSQKKLASIIDGQHRLGGFNRATSNSARSMELLCSVYLDMPLPYQAHLFANINFNQQKVSKGLVYQLFGSTLENELPEYWSPEKAAVFICRKLNIDVGSPFEHHIKVEAIDANEIFKDRQDWYVSTATIVEGILSLISKYPKNDRSFLLRREGLKRSRTTLNDDGTPLRQYYKEPNDTVIYIAVSNFFKAVSTSFWDNSDINSFIHKSVGIRALFQILGLILEKTLATEKNISVDFFTGYLQEASNIDFSDNFFPANAQGMTRIKNIIALKLRLIEEADLSKNDLPEYHRILSSLI